MPRRPRRESDTTFIYYRHTTTGLDRASQEVIDMVKAGMTLEEIKATLEARETLKAVNSDYQIPENAKDADLVRAVITETEIKFDDLASRAGRRTDPSFPSMIKRFLRRR